MSRPLGFPRGGGGLVRLVLGAVLMPLLLVAGVGGWLAWRLTPLQNFYCNVSVRANHLAGRGEILDDEA